MNSVTVHAKYPNAVLIFLAAISLLAGSCTSHSPVAGGTTQEETNARVVATAYTRSGSYAAGALVRLRPADYVATPGLARKQRTRFETVTDDSGRFTIDSLDVGSYRVEINDRESAAVQVAIDIAPDEVDRHLGALALAPYATISGRVDTSTVSDPDSPLFVQVGGLERLAPVGPDGSYEIADLPEGTYTIRLVSTDTDMTPVEIDSVNVTSAQITTVPLFPGWPYAARLTINTTASGTDITEDVFAFPLLVRLSSDTLGSPGGIAFDFSQAAGTGDDIRFSNSDGTTLPSEVEQWDSAAGTAAIWVRVDTILGNSDAQHLLMHWGALSQSSSGSNGAAVFDTANGYAGVWHFADTSPFADATANGNDGIDSGTVAREGIIGQARFYGGTSFGYVPDNATLEPVSLTVSCWVKMDGAFETAVIDSFPKFMHKGFTGSATGFGSYALELRNNSYRTSSFQVASLDSTYHFAASQTDHELETWYLLTGTFDSRTKIGTYYVNGNPVGTFSTPDSILYLTETDYPLTFGAQLTRGDPTKPDAQIRGSIDETRLSSRVRSAAWIRLCYENQKPGSTVVRFGR
jgi:hypothetical protein